MNKLVIINPNYNFGERITRLMQINGIDLKSKKPGPDRILLDRLLAMDIVTLNTEKWDEDKEKIEDYEKRRRYDLTKVISKHRTIASARNISGEWLDNYCKVFGCDSDYLFGYTDTPSKKTTDISDATGLTIKSVDVLRYLHNAKTQVGEETLEILNYIFETQYKTIPEGFSPPNNEETLLYQIRKYVSLKIADKKDYDTPVLIPAGLIGNEEIHSTAGELIDHKKQSCFNKITYQIQEWSNTHSFIDWKENYHGKY